MSKNEVSFYQIAREIAQEDKHIVEINEKKVRLVDDEGKVVDNDKFDNYRKKRQENFEEMLAKAGIINKYKVQTPEGKPEFAIPSSLNLTQTKYLRY